MTEDFLEDAFLLAKTNWLKPEMILRILVDPDAIRFPLSISPPINPSDGQLFLFDQSVVKKYKDDGVRWVMKKGSTHIQESYTMLRVNGIANPLIHGYYCKSIENPRFVRRSYRLASSSNSKGSKLFLVHYRLVDANPLQMDSNLSNSNPNMKNDVNFNSNIIQSDKLQDYSNEDHQFGFPCDVTLTNSPYSTCYTSSMLSQDTHVS